MQRLELREIAGEFDLKRWTFAGETEPAQLIRHAMDEEETLPPFFVGDFVGRFVIVAFDELAGRGNAQAAENSFRLANVNLFGWKIDVSPQFLDLGLGR